MTFNDKSIMSNRKFSNFFSVKWVAYIPNTTEGSFFVQVINVTYELSKKASIANNSICQTLKDENINFWPTKHSNF